MRIASLIHFAEQTLFARLEQGGGGELYVSPLPGSSRTLMIMALSGKFPRVVVLCENVRQVMETEVELSLLGCATPIIAITEYSLSNLQERISLFSRSPRAVILATYRLAEAELPQVEQLRKNLLQITLETAPSYDDLLEYLSLYNYQREDFVDAPGSYSKRGAIIDIWSYSEPEPARLEFDGDMLESLRLFDAESQRSIEKVESFTLAPAIEAGDTALSFTSVFEYFTDAAVLYNEQDAAEFVPEFTEETHAAVQNGSGEKHSDEWYDIPSEPAGQDIAAVETRPPAQGLGALREKYSGIQWICVTAFGKGSGNRIECNLTDAPQLHSNYQLLFSSIRNFAASGITTVIAVENQLQFERYTVLLEEPQNGLTELCDSGMLRLLLQPLKEGFVSTTDSIAVLTDYQIFNKPYRSKLARRLRKPAKRSKLTESIAHGDFVVHEEFGIGKYLGLASISIGETDQESMKLLYSDGGIVYVNLNYLHLVKKYSAKEGIQPALSTLGTADWSNKKKKAKKKIREAAKELIELYAQRKMSKGYAFQPDTVWQQELEASFMYEDTVDQTRVTAEVKTDMQGTAPMDRLVCGDVGFGKTEIAVRAAFKAVQDGKQVAVLVPTTILAEQHYNTFKDRLNQFPLNVEALSRFQSKKEQDEIIERLKSGKTDVVIGTHRILSKDIAFRELGLLIIDEEHRFGVAAKEKLRRYKLNVDILTMTATPIPRTLNLSLLGARDLSILATPPSNRQPIYTKVETAASARLRTWILNEMQRGGQVYVVHDRISTIERFAEYIQKQVPEATVAIVHGQMPPAKLENLFHAFLHKKYDVLLATKIIESGLDIPNVNTIIINRADRFGLAELHQLRGRVGRSERQAYAYLLVPSLEALKKGTVRRLQAIEEHSELGAGFQLAMRDLEIRGAGNLLGTEQTGFINEIGFDLYIKLINESVEELKQEEFSALFMDLESPARKSETVIDAYFELGIPQAYIPDQMDRLGFYTSLSAITVLSELREIEDELRDRFGPMPVLVRRLIMTAELKYFAGYALFQRIIFQQAKSIIVLPHGEDALFYQAKFPLLADLIMTKYKGQIAIVQSKKSLQLHVNRSFNVPEAGIEFLTAFSKEIAALFGYGDNAAPTGSPA